MDPNVTRTATYQLKRIVDRLGHWARVTVVAEPAEVDDASGAADAFDWRRAVYGPDAAVGGVEDDRMLAEAVAGVAYVLALPETRPRFRVVVTEVCDAPVDTGPGDVKLAAALACVEVLGLELADPPRLEPTGVVFP